MNPTVTLALDRDALRLSDTLAVTLTVVGPAPLVVELPKEPLADDTAAVWAVATVGPAKVTPQPGGRERWDCTLTLSPFLPGDGQTIQFAPLTVNGRPAEVPTAAASVRTNITTATPDQARPVTGPEPPPAGPGRAGFDWLDAVPAVSVAAVLLLGAAVWLARRGRPTPVTPGTWVAAELDTLDRQLAAGEDPAAVCDRLDGVLRQYAERRYGVPAVRRTTAERLAGDAGPALEPLRPVFERCDLSKFAGRGPTADEARELLRQARAAVL